MPDDLLVLDSLPDDVIATMQVRDRWMSQLRRSTAGLEFVVSDVQRWRPGQTVRVAFLGGTTALHRDVANATDQITSACNLKLDFGFDQSSGTYRTWSESDTTYGAEIRVSFDMGGFFSLVGTDSIDAGIGSPSEPVGGRPGQRSLNLGGFIVRRPNDWARVVRHEFLHALAFHHSHQNMRGPCELAFRWEDDERYEPTRDANGAFVPDSSNRRPGIYTYLAGAPNFWSRGKVDHNLRRLDDPEIIPGPFDRESVMLYRFPDLFYRTTPSLCAPLGDSVDLSQGDIRGLRLLYPETANEMAVVIDRRAQLLETIEGPPVEDEGLESLAPGARSEIARRIGATLRATLIKDEG